MNVLLQINILINSGSTGRIAEEIGQTAIEAGWESYIAYGREMNRTSKSHKIRIGADWDIKSHALQTRILDNHSLGLSSRRATKELIKKIEQIKPDIIHLHNLHGYYINIEVLFNCLSKLDTPIVWTFHDCWPFTGHCAHFDYIGCDKWKTGCYKCPLKKSYPASFVIDRSKKNYEDKKRLFNSVRNLTLVPVSNWLGNFFKDSFLHKHKVKLIHNGINTSIFQPRKIDTQYKGYNFEGKFVLLGVATSWGKSKGLYDFIEMSTKLSLDFQIVLVGLTPDQIKELPDNIIGITRTESVDELAELYSVADIFLNPTYNDTFPTTNLEALACGTPVITYNTGGSPEAVDTDTGIVVEKGNVLQMISAILEIKQKGKQHYFDACRNRALQLYRKEDRYRDYLHLYDELLSTPR